MHKECFKWWLISCPFCRIEISKEDLKILGILPEEKKNERTLRIEAMRRSADERLARHLMIQDQTLALRFHVDELIALLRNNL